MPEKRTILFGPFEMDLQAGELRRHGIRLKLQEQPFQVLAMLVARAGDVVLREDLQKRLWPADTFVDFDHGLSSAINKLREALSDAADSPRYIETVPRRGYRFIALLNSPATPAQIEIEEARISSRKAEPNAPAAGLRQRWNWRGTLLWGASSLLLAVFTGLAVWYLKPAPASPLERVSRVTITLPPGQHLADLENGSAVALSRDGALLAYVARQGGVQQLYLRAMDSPEANPISGTEGAADPFFSPDDQWLGFFADGMLNKVSVSGGPAVTLAHAMRSRGASWGSQSTIAFAPDPISSIQQVPDSKGTAQPLTRFDKEEFTHRWPDFLPDGKTTLFAGGGSSVSGNWTTAQVVAQAPSGKRWKLIQGGTFPRYATSGHLLFVQAGTLMAVPFDPQRVELTGKVVPVVENVVQSPASGAAQYCISDTGSLAYIRGGVQAAQRKLVWVGRNGAERPLTAAPHAYVFPRLSPDGRRVAVEILEQEQQIWLYDLDRDTLTKLTFGGDTNSSPVWTPDSRRITYESNAGGASSLTWLLVSGSIGMEQLTSSEYPKFPSSISPDGQLLAFTEPGPARGWDVWVLRLADRSAGSRQFREAQPFLRNTFNNTMPRFSPDGRWLAYVSDESGRPEVYVQPFPGPGGKWQISTEGGTEPIWNRNDRELFYRNGKKMMSAEITTRPEFSAGKPRTLFAGDYVLSPRSPANYDVSPDGQRFLLIKESEQESAFTQINLVLNWFEELKRRVPPDQGK